MREETRGVLAHLAMSSLQVSNVRLLLHKFEVDHLLSSFKTVQEPGYHLTK
jgi:hypothetical protein